MSRRPQVLPPGCVAFLALFAFFLVPFFFAHLMLGAVAKLGLSPDLALLVLVGIFLGGAVNIPVKKFVREQEVADPLLLFGAHRFLPRLGFDPLFPLPRRAVTQTIIAVNLGGCVIPVALAIYETVRVLARGPQESLALLGITVISIGVCYRIARPVPRLGIVMPAFIPPLTAALPSLWFVPEFAPPVAFVAGVLGPLIGADLLHLREIQDTPTGMASIGGAGTFDGIVLSGMLAALLA